MSYINQNGQPQGDNQIWESLYEKRVNDAQGFAKEDLNKYRGYLSDSEYKQFLKAQDDIKKGDYYSTLKDDDKMIKAALKSAGLDHGNRLFDNSGNVREVAFNEIKALTRELEARKGRKITDEELQNITNSLGYKGSDGVLLYKQLEKGMNTRVGFTNNVINDIVYYQKTHNGQMPSDEEKYKIINNRLNQEVQTQKSQAQQKISNYSYNATTMRNIAYTKAKPHEQKVLTYFADTQIPTISTKLGFKLTVTSRYRNQPGSHHAEGRAADISTSELTREQKIRAHEEVLALPNVVKIGTSDPDVLSHFAGNTKIKDERNYDRQHGTNHKNHSHVTLINANPAKPNSNNGTKSSNNIYRL